MSTRFKSESTSNFGISPLPTGLETKGGPADLSIPPCGVEDVDVALFKLFDKEISPECGGGGSDEVKRVPVVFAAGEKWSMLKNGRPLRDRNNTLILPLITIMRTEVSQTPEDFAGRGINQQVGEIVIRRRLDKSDRGYQNLINKYLLQNQDNVAIRDRGGDVPGQVTTARKLGELADTPDAKAGVYLKPQVKNNVYETLVVPTPQFYTAKYQVTIWTQYTQHANQIVEKIMGSLLPQAQSWKITTDKGYWFTAKLEDGNFAMETSFEDMAQQERFIKQTFNVSVPAYFFATASPGTPVPVKRYVSAPTIVFEVQAGDPTESTTDTTGTSFDEGDPTIPRPDRKPLFGDTTPKVLSRSPRGETVYSGGLELIVVQNGIK